MRKKSIKKNLIFRLSALIIFALIVTYSIAFVSARSEVRDVFDADLIKSAKLILGITKHEDFKKNEAALIAKMNDDLVNKISNKYEHEIHAQAWKDGEIIYNSGEKISLPMPNYQGFKDVLLGEEKWRSFSIFDEESQIFILILEKEKIRQQLIFDIAFSLLLPLGASFIFLFFIIQSSVNQELQPLEKLAGEIEKISGKTLKQFSSPQVPLELQSFLKAFNSLLARLAASLESEQRFTDYAAHELNTPLAAIKIQAQLLEKNKDETKREKYLQNLLKGIDRATHLVEQLLTLARIETDNKNFKKEKFNLKDLVEFLITTYEKKAEGKNVKIEFSSAEIFVTANKTYIEILVGNLLSNAIKYSFEGKNIFVELTQKKNSPLLKISNFGDEISSEEIKKIFGNFYRLKQSNSAGCGLGLAIAKKIIELHNGSILFKSEDGVNSVEVLI